MELLEGIYSRRSVREFTAEPVDHVHVLEIIKAGTCAPSGLNNQPWRFVIVRGAVPKKELSELTEYRNIIENAPVCIAVFIDKQAMYHEVKDFQAIGACLQNMLLAAHALGLGAVWLGEILRNADRVRQLLVIPDSLDLMAVIAIGHPASRKRRSTRKKISEVLLKEF